MFRLFARDKIIKRVEGFKPLLAQWEKNTHPAQIRLTEYLEWITNEISPKIDHQADLFLYLEVDVVSPSNLLKHHDLENYLTPLFGRKWLDPSKFVCVSGRKKVGGGSFIEIGKAKQISEDQFSGWNEFNCKPGSGTASPKWKEAIRQELALANVALMPPGPVEVHLAWRCSLNRNWVNLWKPTGDAMGPALGYENPADLYNPRDDRIVRLSMHKTIVPGLGHIVEVGMWWN